LETLRDVALPATLPRTDDLATIRPGESAPPPPPPKDGPEEVPTNPRIDVESLGGSLQLPPAPKILDPLPPPIEERPSADELTPPRVEAPDLVVPSIPAPPPPFDEDAAATVDAMLAGDSLTSAERAQLLLGVARLLVEKGVLTREDLIRMLSG
jgi:hypothetical protein